MDDIVAEYSGSILLDYLELHKRVKCGLSDSLGGFSGWFNDTSCKLFIPSEVIYIFLWWVCDARQKMFEKWSLYCLLFFQHWCVLVRVLFCLHYHLTWFLCVIAMNLKTDSHRLHTQPYHSSNFVTNILYQITLMCLFYFCLKLTEFFFHVTFSPFMRLFYDPRRLFLFWGIHVSFIILYMLRKRS